MSTVFRHYPLGCTQIYLEGFASCLNPRERPPANRTETFAEGVRVTLSAESRRIRIAGTAKIGGLLVLSLLELRGHVFLCPSPLRARKLHDHREKDRGEKNPEKGHPYHSGKDCCSQRLIHFCTRARSDN